MPWWFTFCAMSLSFVAATAALWSWFRVRKLLDAASLRSLASLSKDVAELTACFESLQETIKRISSREGMAAMRARRRDASSSSTSTSDDIGETPMPREKLKEIARARGFKVT